jgi:hypothetical protein
MFLFVALVRWVVCPEQDSSLQLVQFNCKENHYNDLASFMLSPAEVGTSPFRIYVGKTRTNGIIRSLL